MLANCGGGTRELVQALATGSAEMYPEFVHELQEESGLNVDLRDYGTLLFPPTGHEVATIKGAHPLPTPLSELEPALAPGSPSAVFLKERSVCPRALGPAALQAAKHRGVDGALGG